MFGVMTTMRPSGRRYRRSVRSITTGSGRCSIDVVHDHEIERRCRDTGLLDGAIVELRVRDIAVRARSIAGARDVEADHRWPSCLSQFVAQCPSPHPMSATDSPSCARDASCRTTSQNRDDRAGFRLGGASASDGRSNACRTLRSLLVAADRRRIDPITSA